MSGRIAMPGMPIGRPSHLSLSHKSELLTLPAVRVGLPDTLDRAVLSTCMQSDAIRCNHAGHARSEVIRGHQRSSELACRTRSIAQRAASRCLAAPVTRRACCTCGTPMGRRGEHSHARQVISGNLVAISCCTWNSFPMGRRG